MIDFRKPENRREAFIRWFVWGLRTTDCDPSINMMNYIFHRQEYNIEQRLWSCWLYANTYQLPTSYLIFNEFPDYENVDQDRLDDWNSREYQRLIYQTDCKYSKGHLARMFRSYCEMVGPSQIAFFNSVCDSTDPKENYNKLFLKIINDFYKFGRYTAWFYCQVLKDCAGLNIEATSLLLGENGSDSHTDGMCYVANREDLLTRFYIDGVKHKNTKGMIIGDKASLQVMADDILEEIKVRFPDVKADYFLMETALCSFKKLFRRSRGRYLGYYLDRMGEDIVKIMHQKWNGIDWDIMWDYRRECLNHNYMKEITGGRFKYWVDTDKMNEFLDTGTLADFNIYEDLKNE